jgi:CBS domain-containing membrane protein
MKVRDLMTTEVVLLDARSPLISAEEVMGLRRVRHLPCVEEGRFVGLITHRDLLRAYLPGGSAVERAIHASKHRVREFMHTDVQTVGPDVELTTAARLLRTHKWGCLPVVSEDGKLIGIVTDSDFLELAEVVIEAMSEMAPETLAAVRARMDRPA